MQTCIGFKNWTDLFTDHIKVICDNVKNYNYKVN